MRNISSKAPKLFVRIGVIFLLFVLSATTVFVRPAHAGLKQTVHDIVAKVVPEIDITKTLQSIAAEALTGVAFTVVLQRNGDEVFNCSIVHMISALDGGEASVVSRMTAGASGLSQEDAQALVTDAVAAVDTYEPDVCDFCTSSFASRNSGSLAGVGLVLQEVGLSDPIPVNMASFFKYYAQRIPIIRDTAYAQSPGSWVGGDMVLEIWQLTRNIAYGIVSIVMLVVGIMVMTRKKMNPQVVVTVQNALPRVVLALILITFSYPIGAFFASMVGVLVGAAISIFGDLMTSVLSSSAASSCGIGGSFLQALVANSAFLMSYMGAGLTAVLLGALLLVVALVLWVFLLIKALFIYMKILISVMVAPIQFAVGAIPGNEETTLKWFKEIAANVLSIPLMFFITFLGFYILFAFTYIYAAPPSSASFLGTTVETVGRLGIIIMFGLFGAFGCLMCFGMSISIPKKVKGFIVGEPKRGK